MSAKKIVIKLIDSSNANRFIKQHHYSGKVVQNSKLHFGVYYMGKLGGVMQYGPPMRKDLVLGLVKGTGWREMLELNRMAFTDVLPRNSESRALAVTAKIIKKQYPFMKWILTFADGCQCGDGTIYRAAGFYLTGIKKNEGMRINPADGKPMMTMAAYHKGIAKEHRKWKAVDGYMLRYIKLLDYKLLPDMVPVLDYAEIKKAGASMYLGRPSSGEAGI